MNDLMSCLASGDLEAAVASGIAAVKAKPTDAEARYRLFAVLVFGGDLHKARKQLEALGVGDVQLERAKAMYINLLAAEQERRAVHDLGAEPLLPPDPPEHLKLRLSALAALRDGDAAGARERIEQAVAVQPELTGTLDGRPFTALRDLDDVLGSLLEVFAGGRTILLPFERIAKLEITPPSHLLDLIWLPAVVTDVHGATSSVHLPVLYAGSHLAQEPRAATGAATEWFDQGEGLLRGRGQRLLAAAGDGDVRETPLLEVRRLELTEAD